MILLIIKCILQNNSHGTIRILLTVISRITNILLHIILLLMVLTWNAIQYLIKIALILVIWERNCLISPTEEDLMGGIRLTREGYGHQQLRVFPKQNLILIHYMLSAWHIMDGLGSYVLQLGTIEQVLVITINLMIFGYTNCYHRLKRLPDIFIHSHTFYG